MCYLLGYKKVIIIAKNMCKENEFEKEFPEDYCMVGKSSCNCGWQGEYPVSGCPLCHESFCE